MTHLTVIDTQTGRTRQQAIAPAGLLVTAQEAIQGLMQPRFGIEVTAAAAGRYQVVDADGEELARYNAAETFPAAAKTGGGAAWDSRPTAKQIAYLTTLMERAPAIAVRRFVGPDVNALDRRQVSRAIDALLALSR